MVNDVQLFLPLVDTLNLKVKELSVRVVQCEERLEGLVGKMSDMRVDVLDSLQVLSGRSHVGPPSSGPRCETATPHPANQNYSSKWKLDLREKARAAVLMSRTHVDLPLEEIMVSAQVVTEVVTPGISTEMEASRSCPGTVKDIESSHHPSDGEYIDQSELPNLPPPEPLEADSSLDTVEIDREIEEVMASLCVLRRAVLGGAAAHPSGAERGDGARSPARQSPGFSLATPPEPEFDLQSKVPSHATTKSSSTLSDAFRSVVAERESRRRVTISDESRSPLQSLHQSSSDISLNETSYKAPSIGALRATRFNFVQMMVNNLLSRTRAK